MDKIVQSLAKYFRVENILIDNDQDGWHMLTIIKFKDKELYTHKLDLRPLYVSMKERLDKESVDSPSTNSSKTDS